MNNVHELKEKLKVNKQKGLALDIDETLSWTIGYWVEKMQEKFGNPEHLSVKELIKKYRYAQDVPYWQTKEALEWMEKSRTSNDLQEEFELIENANYIVQKINEIVPILVYITVRPVEVMDGTKKWLEKYGFPIVDIIARPNSVDSAEGHIWKAHVLEKLYPQVVGIIDDNPSLVMQLSKDYKGVVYLYDNAKSPRKDISVFPCETWESVLQAFKDAAILETK